MQNEQSKDSTSNVKMIGLDTDVTLVGLNGDNPLRAKIDTGAEECSLDAQNLDEQVDEISGSGTVAFSLGEYSYKMAISGFQAISSADGGTKNRPTIKLGIRLGEEYFPDVTFNLNDRSGMEYPVLLGHKFLQVSGFVVDPKLSEDIEIVFGDQEEAVNNPVDVSPESQDNTASDVSTEALVAWFNANKTKTLGQLMAELIKTGSTTDGKD